MAKKSKTNWAKGAAASGSASSEAPVPSVTWEELVERAEAELDENGVASMEKRRHTAEKKWRRLGERGMTLRVNREGVERALCAYFEDCFGGAGRMRGIRKVFAGCGVSLVDYTDGADYYPEFALVMEYIRRNRGERDRLLAEEAGSLAQESQMRLVTEEGCELNQKAVEVSLKATMKDVYGDGAESGGADAKKSVTYCFPNLQATWIIADPAAVPAVAGQAAIAAGRGVAEPEAIDV